MIDLTWLQVILALIGVVGGGGGIWAMIKMIMDRPRARAEVEHITITTMTGVVDELRTENRRLTDRVGALESRELVIVGWAWRVWETLTGEQRAQVGPPPITQREI